MKSDTLTLAAVVLLIGILATGLGQMGLFSSETEAPSELQRGFQQASTSYEQ